jgi:hypothetical protein
LECPRLLEHCGKAINGDDIEANARADHDSRDLRIRVPALRGNEDIELAGDVEIVGPAHKAGIDHWRAGR